MTHRYARITVAEDDEGLAIYGELADGTCHRIAALPRPTGADRRSLEELRLQAGIMAGALRRGQLRHPVMPSLRRR